MTKKKESSYHLLYLLATQISSTHVSTADLKQETIVKGPITRALQHSEYLRSIGTEEGFGLHSVHTVKGSTSVVDFVAEWLDVLPRPVQNTGQEFPSNSFDQ